MHHRVGVLDTGAVGTALLLEDGHEGVVVLLVLPIPLPLQQSRDGRQARCPGLHHARECRLLGRGRGRAAAIFNDVDIVAGLEHGERGPGDANLRPQAGHQDVFPARGLDGLSEAGIVPRVHRAALHDRLAGEHVEQLWQDVAAEALRLDSRQDGGHIELLRHAGEKGYVINEGRAVNAAHAEEHLRLMVDEHDRAVLWGI
jgi:hypothetical protein